MEDVRDLTYDELEHRFDSTLRRYARWQIVGMDMDDVHQELRLVLFRAQQLFRRNVRVSAYQPKPASFRTYLLRAIKNKLGKLQCKAAWTLRAGAVYTDRGPDLPPRRELRIPSSLESLDTEPGEEIPSIVSAELLADFCGAAYDIVGYIVEGQLTRGEWMANGLTYDQVELGLAEIRTWLRRNVRGTSTQEMRL